MYTIPRFSVSNPVLVNLLTFLVIVGGTASLFLLPRELFPRVASDFVLVITLYPRASADEIEKTVTLPIEEEISDVIGIKEMRSTTAEGRSVILLEVDTDVEPIDRVQRNVENEVDQVIPKLPAGCEKPITKEFIFEFPVVTVSVAGAVDAHELQAIAESIQDRLRTIPGVSDVTLAGEKDQEVWVEVDPLRLYGYELTLSEVREAIQIGG
jgi:multidrug efflux pump subunit AcrB